MNKEGKARDNSIDILKGIGILLVICAHVNTIPFDCDIKRAIYAFHMPLFFLASGYFYKPRKCKESIVKDAKRLLIPLALTLALCSIIYSYQIYKDGFRHYISTMVSMWTLRTAGPVWFLMALFVCKNAFNCICTKTNNLLHVNILSIIISFTVYVLDTHVYGGGKSFCFTQGLIAIPFYSVGYTYRVHKTYIDKCLYIPIALIVIYFAYVFYTDRSIIMMSNSYNFYPLETIVGSGGTLLVYYISKVADRTKLSRVLGAIGRLSLLILCIHAIEMNIGIRSLCSNPVCQGLIMLVCSIPVAFLICRIPFVKRIFL